MDVSEEVRGSWNEHWRQRDKEFEDLLHSDPDLSFLLNKMFFVWDGNHRLMAWVPYIASKHSQELKWHYAVEARLLLTLGHTGVLIDAMNDINRYSFNHELSNSFPMACLIHVIFTYLPINLSPFALT